MTTNRPEDWRHNMFRRIGGEDLARRLGGPIGVRQDVQGAAQQAETSRKATLAEKPVIAAPSRGDLR